MKALVFYFTAVLTMILLVSEINITWLVLATLDIILITYCHNNITLEEFIKYSGYKQWYKLLKL